MALLLQHNVNHHIQRFSAVALDSYVITDL